MHEKPGIFNQLCHSLVEEFQREKLSLSHEPSEDFFKSQWQRQSKSLLWLIYRWLFATFFSVGVLGSLIQKFADGKWFIFLTDWGFVMCMYSSIFGAVLVTIYYCSKDKIAVSPRTLKVYWASYWTTLTLATLITTVYWIFVFPTENVSALAVYNLWAHGFNSMLMILDHMLVAFPARILHFVFPVVVGLIYGLFSLIYYYAGGFDPFGNRYIYEILDWSKPGVATLSGFGCLLLIFIFTFFHFGVYKLRTFLYRRLNKSEFTLNV